jgi:integrase
MKVTIEKHQNRLRLRWRFEGKRYSLSIGVKADWIGYALAQQRRKRIRLALDRVFMISYLLMGSGYWTINYGL